MSVRVLYRKIPVNQRICSYYRCQKRILRNIDTDDKGHIYHHGCKMAAMDEKYECLNCFNRFDATEASFEETQILKDDLMKASFQVVCPSCGSMDLKPRYKRNMRRLLDA